MLMSYLDVSDVLELLLLFCAVVSVENWGSSDPPSNSQLILWAQLWFGAEAANEMA